MARGLSWRSRTFFVVLSVASAIPCAANAAEFAVEKNDRGVTVKLDGALVTEYLVKSGTKPILWPLIGPTGKGVTRSYPMNAKPPAFEKQDHPHHRSFWFTHGNVNGVDFWMEGAKAGTIRHREFTEVAGGSNGTIGAINDWHDPAGKKICQERRKFVFGADADARWIDVDLRVEASEGDLTFGDTKEGSFGVRVHETMKVDAKKGGKIVNSRGQTDGATWGKPAEWVDYQGPVEGETLGIAIFNHPTSFRYPTTWHVRTYGLFAANPFGLGDFTNKKEDGKHVVKSGDALTLRYRVVMHRGDEKTGRIAERFAEYAKGK
jgi:hypothetical protein